MDELVFFDLEIAKSLPEDIDDWREAGPLGISCAATVTSSGEEKLWYSSEYGEFLPQMTPRDVSDMAAYMADIAYQGGYIVTWNGLSFDMPVVAEECHDVEWYQEFAELSMSRHIDLGFLMHCEKGYFIALDKCAKGLGLHGKTEGMHGALAPILWNGLQEERNISTPDSVFHDAARLGLVLESDEARELCLKYVMQDAITTKEVYEELLGQGSVKWITKVGKPSRYPYIPSYVYGEKLVLSGIDKPWDKQNKEHIMHQGQGRFPTVTECLGIPVPNTSWMDREPKNREAFYRWITSQKGEN